MTVRLDSEANELAEELSGYTGETIPEAIRNALRERLQREKEKQGNLKDELLRIGEECAALPVLDNRTAEEILGYNEIGAPS